MKEHKNIANDLSLFETIYTVSELQLFYKEIDIIISSLYHENVSIEQILGELVSPDKNEKIIAYLKAHEIDLTKPIEIQETLLKIKAAGNTLPVVSLALAFEPTEQILKNFTLWFTRNVEKKVLFNISLERQELGGAHIAFDGLYKDLTLKTKIDEYFNGQKLFEETSTRVLVNS